ncbi:MAG: hypothetical protein ACYC99_03045 [Candidatus Geothermincolia bacterium]
MELGALLDSLDYRYILGMEWISSVLMMATVWGWLYKTIYPRIATNLAASKRHYLAIDRLVRIRAKEAQSKVEEVDRLRRDIGITSMTPFITRMRLLNEEKRIHARLRKFELMPEEIEERTKRTREANAYLIRLILLYYVSMWLAKVKLGAMSIVHSVTVHLFAGKLRVAVFLTGFALWNLSKALAIYVRTVSATGICP